MYLQTSFCMNTYILACNLVFWHFYGLNSLGYIHPSASLFLGLCLHVCLERLGIFSLSLDARLLLFCLFDDERSKVNVAIIFTKQEKHATYFFQVSCCLSMSLRITPTVYPSCNYYMWQAILILFLLLLLLLMFIILYYFRRKVSRMTSFPSTYICVIWCMLHFTLLAQLSASMLLLHRSVNFSWNFFRSVIVCENWALFILKLSFPISHHSAQSYCFKPDNPKENLRALLIFFLLLEPWK